MKRITVFAAIISGFMLAGANAAFAAAADPGCAALGGNDTGLGTTCTLAGTRNFHGSVTLGEKLHMLANAKIVTGTLGAPLGITINIENGDLVMETGALIDGNVSGCNTGGNITVNLEKGNVDLKKGSIIRSNSCSGGAIVITTSGSHTATIDGTVESVGSISGTGPHQRPGGGTITVKAGCSLTVSDFGVVSSRGKDPGADLVHLEGCSVVINGLVESTGPGHVLPDSPANHCNLQPTAHVPGGSPSTFFTACVEIWSGTKVLIDDKDHNGQVNADTGLGGGSNGRGWIDIYARKDITITGMVDPLIDNTPPPLGGGCSGHVNTLSGAHPGCSAADRYAVHANGGLGVNTDDGGLITIMSEQGGVITSNQAVQASATAGGSAGGDVRIEAGGNIVFGTASIQAKGATSTTGHGGHIAARSYSGAVSGSAGGELNAAGDSPPDGTVVLQACTAAPSATYVGTVVPSLTPTAPSCSPAQPTLPPDVPTGSCLEFCQLLQCEPSLPFKFTDVLPPGVTNINQPGYAEGQRGMFNKDGSPCPPVNYLFTNNILNSNEVNLKWDAASQPGAAFRYTVTWKPEYVDLSSGLPSRITKVNWYDSTGTSLVYPPPGVPGHACLNPNLPAPYGTLSGDIDAAQTSIPVAVTAAVPALPFPIMVGNERMTVTGGAPGPTWTVARGGSNGTSAAIHPSGAFVMSTPLPLDSSGILMRMCIVEEGWNAYPPGVPDCPIPPPGLVPLACVLFTTTVFDLGDGFMSR